MDLREEYATKLESLGEKHDLERQRLLKEQSVLQSRVESQATQLAYMERKEAKLFGQLEEARALQEAESQAKEARLRDMEALVH